MFDLSLENNFDHAHLLCLLDDQKAIRYLSHSNLKSYHSPFRGILTVFVIMDAFHEITFIPFSRNLQINKMSVHSILFTL